MKKDLSELPTESQADLPEWAQVAPTNEFTSRFVDFWFEKYKASGRMDKDFALPGSRIRGSWAGKCARRLSYEMMGVPETNPTETAAFWRMEQGTIAHDYWQAAAAAMLGDAAIVEAKGSFAEGDGSLHTDLVVESKKYGKVAFELKTIGGFGFKVALGMIKNEPGPKPDHFLQGALGAKAHDADYLVIAYISQENVNPGWATDALPHPSLAFSAEWMFPKEMFLPYAEREEHRLKMVLDLAKMDEVAPRSVPLVMPKGSRIVDPIKSVWHHRDGEAIVGTGNIWGGNYCKYCNWQDQCVEDLKRENGEEE